MRKLIRTLRIAAAVAALFTLPNLTHAANRTWSSMITTPNSTNITAGVAANLSANVAIANGTGASTRFIGTGTITATVSPADPTVTATISPTNLTWINSNATNTTTLTVTTTSLTPSNTYVVSIVVNTNPVNVNVTPVTNTFTISMATAAPFNPLMVWAPGGVNGNWSTPGNWSPTGPPGSSNDVRFFDAGAVGTTNATDNTVDVSTTLASLAYGPSNTGDFHTTLIASGKTLTITGTNGLAVGTGTDPGDSVLPTVAITGAGASLTVSNSSALVNIGQSHTTANNAISHSQALLDLSSLDKFTANVSRLLVGTDTSIKGGSGILNLAKTNSFTATVGSAAPQLDIGDNTQASGSPAISSMVLLGKSNSFNVDSIAVGRGKTDGTGAFIQFNAAFASPSVIFRGTNGNSSRVGSWIIGDGAGARTFFTFGTCDFSLGTVDALVNSMIIGQGANAALANGANNPGTGTLTINAGTLDVNTLLVGNSISANGTGTINVNGGSLVVNTNLQLAISTNASGALNIAGGIVTANAGIAVGGGSSAVIAMTGGTLNVTNTSATIGSSVSGFSTLSLSGATLKVASQSLSPSIFVTNLIFGGAANTLNVSAVPLISSFPSQFPLIQYGNITGDPTTLTLGALPPGIPPFAGYLTNDVANSSIDLVLTGGPQFFPLVWDGAASGDWDTSTANWKTNGVLTTYQQGYLLVRFDDTVTGATNVNLTSTLTPGNVTVSDSAKDYTFGGTGKLSGVMGLTKDGTHTLTLTESGGDDFTGGVSVIGGTLQIGNGGTSGNLPAGAASIGASGALVFDRSDNVAVPTVFSGLGTVEQTSSSIVALNGSNNAFSGQILVAHGTIQAGNTAALGTPAATVTVSSGATLDVNGQKFNNTESITATGAGVNSLGAIVNNSTNNTTQVLRVVTLAGNTTFGGTGDWDIHASGNSATDAQLNTGGMPWNLTKVGSNTVTLFGAMVDGSLADISIQAGTISFERNSSGLGDPSHTVTVFTNATLQLGNASNVWTKLVTLQNGGIFRAVNSNEFAGAVSFLSGTGTLFAGANGVMVLDTAVGGAGGMIKGGAGQVVLNSPSTYTGSTLISAGNLTLNNSGSIDSSTNITITAGATLDLSPLASPTLTLTSGRTLAGSGTVLGSMTMNAGSTLSVGGPGTNIFGALTITNSLVMQPGSTNIFQIGKNGAVIQNAQVITTNVTYAGTLVVNGAGGVFAPGDTFKLFAAGSYNNSFNVLNLPVGITWDTSRLGIDGTIKVVSVSLPQFSAIPVITNGSSFSLTFTGPGGNSYRVWGSTNIAARPITNTWTVLATNNFNNLGLGNFLDTTASNFPNRFYVITIP